MKFKIISEKQLNLVWGGINIYPILSSNMKEIRKKRKLSQLRVSIDMNIDQSTLSKYESGRRNPDLNYILRFCKFYNISVTSLMEPIK